jgi:hypothetical protein
LNDTGKEATMDKSIRDSFKGIVKGNADRHKKRAKRRPPLASALQRRWNQLRADRHLYLAVAAAITLVWVIANAEGRPRMVPPAGQQAQSLPLENGRIAGRLVRDPTGIRVVRVR